MNPSPPRILNSLNKIRHVARILRRSSCTGPQHKTFSFHGGHVKRFDNIPILFMGTFLSLGILYAANTASAQSVSVAKVEELYAAVNNLANIGATITISPGI